MHTDIFRFNEMLRNYPNGRQMDRWKLLAGNVLIICIYARRCHVFDRCDFKLLIFFLVLNVCTVFRLNNH